MTTRCLGKVLHLVLHIVYIIYHKSVTMYMHIVYIQYTLCEVLNEVPTDALFKNAVWHLVTYTSFNDVDQ